MLGQVQQVPKQKPKKKTEEEKAQEALAMTWAEKALQAAPDLLNDISNARTSALKLSGIVYAKDLAAQLNGHATKLESYYKDVQNALESKASEKSFEQLMTKVAAAGTFTENAIAAAQAFLKKPSKKKGKAKPKAAPKDA